MISGIICLFNLAVDQYPNISPPSVGVNASYTGADAQTVEQTVAIPIEEQVNGTPGMEYMQSSSTNTGSVSVRVTFNIGVNPQIAALNVQNRVGIAAPLLPAVVSKLGATVRASNPDQLLLIAVYSPKGTHGITFLDNYTSTFINDAILRVPGVGDVTARTDQFSMRIWMNPDKMASYSLTPADVVAALNAQNVYVAAGSVGAPPQAPTQTHETGILVNSMLNKPAQYENIIVKTIPAQRPARLFLFTDVSAQCIVKLEVTRVSVLTSARNHGRSHWMCVPGIDGGHCPGWACALTTRSKK